MSKKVLLSTDIGSDIDDALALLSMLNSEMDLRGIYTVNGDVRSRAFIAKHMVDLFKRKINVATGESLPFGGDVGPYYFFVDCHVDNRFVDDEKSRFSSELVYKPLKKVGIIEKGLEELITKLENGKYTILSIGPLTNIAKLIQQNPEVTRNIEQLYIMGCNFSEDRIKEHNVRFDIPAAIEVFNSNVPIIVVPADLCKRYQMPTEQLEQLESRVGRYVKKMGRSFIAIKTATRFATGRGYFLRDFSDVIDQEIACPSINDQNRERIAKKISLKSKLLVNLNDPYYGAFDPNEYFQQYQKLIEHLEDTELNYRNGKKIGKMLRELIPKSIYISDVYVPYCFLNPEKIKIVKGNIQIDFDGISYLTEGSRHTIVTDIDLGDFKRFLEKHLK